MPSAAPVAPVIAITKRIALSPFSGLAALGGRQPFLIPVATSPIGSRIRVLNFR